TNLSLHAAAVALLFGILFDMTGQRCPSLLVAALFGLHPLHVESVAWVAERKDVLSGFFWMLTLWAYFHYALRSRWDRYLLLIMVFGWDLLAKPMLVSLPLVLLLLDYWPVNQFDAGADRTGFPDRSERHREGVRRACRLISEKAPLFLLALCSSLMTVWAQHE